MNKKIIKILIADDHDVVRTGLKMLFRSVPEFSVVAEATNGNEAVALASRHKPHVAILDISMPSMNGIEATRVIREQQPDVKILILTIHESEEYVYQMVRAGANGYALKDSGKKELFTAVRAVATGERFFSPGISNLMIEKFLERVEKQGAREATPSKSPLTKREIEVLQAIARGLTNQKTAKMLFLSVRTVDGIQLQRQRTEPGANLRRVEAVRRAAGR